MPGVSFVQQTGIPDISIVPSDAAPLLRDGRGGPAAVQHLGAGAAGIRRRAAAADRVRPAPSLGSYEDGWGLSRTGDALNASIPLFSTAGNWAYTESWGSYANASTKLSLDGKEIAVSPYPGWISANVGAAGRYTLSTVTDRPAPYSAFGTHASASWTFNSPGTTASRTALPLLVVRASGKTDSEGLAPSPFPARTPGGQAEGRQLRTNWRATR